MHDVNNSCHAYLTRPIADRLLGRSRVGQRYQQYGDEVQSIRHSELITELESAQRDDWGSRALLACLRKLRDGGPTEAASVIVENAWATSDEFRVVYSFVGGRRIGIIRNRETTIDRTDVYATGDVATPEEFGREVADFNIGEPLGVYVKIAVRGESVTFRDRFRDGLPSQ